MGDKEDDGVSIKGFEDNIKLSIVACLVVGS